MHLVYIANSVIPSRAAYSIHVMKMCQAFEDNGHEVTLLVPERKSKEAEVDQISDFYDVDSSFQIEKLSRPNVSSFGTFAYNYLAGRMAAQLNPDLAYGRTVIGCYFAAARGVPTAFESHGPIDQGRFDKIQQLRAP